MGVPESLAVAGNGWLVLSPGGSPLLSEAQARALEALAADRWSFPNLEAGLLVLDLPGPASPVPGSERRERGSANPSAEAAALGLPEGFRIESLRALFHILPEAEAKRAARALHLANWRRRMRHCPVCGTALQGTALEGSSSTPSLLCPSCGLEDFPRIAPAVIVLVERKGRILLARNANFSGGMHSLIAGFVEAGESLEEAAGRELGEEVGLRVSELRYVASQPWPFPDSLMVGFRATADSPELHPDGKEIVEAGWFDPTDLPPIPRRGSIARSLIDLWLSERGFSTE